MSKREELRKRRQQQALRQRLIGIAAVVALAFGATGFMIFQNTRPIGEFVTITPTPRPAYADGKALGPKDAPVLIEEFSDFQ